MIQRSHSLILGLVSLRSYPPNLFVPTCALLILSVPFSTIAQPAMPFKGGGPHGNIHPSLDLTALTGPLQELTPEERKVVDETVELIRQKRHTAALLNLSRLIGSNPKNSALRVLRAYVYSRSGMFPGRWTRRVPPRPPAFVPLTDAGSWRRLPILLEICHSAVGKSSTSAVTNPTATQLKPSAAVWKPDRSEA